MKYMKIIKPEKKKRPINQIKIAGTQILNIDLNQGWEITNIEFNDCCPSSYIDELVVTFEKVKGKYKMYDEQNIETAQTSETEYDAEHDFCSLVERRTDG